MKLKKIPIYTFTAITVAIILGLWTTGSMSLLNPIEWRWLALSGYAFPAFLLMTLGMLVLWTVLRQWRLLLITVIGLVVAYMPVTLYCPLHHSTETPDDAIQVMTFNTDNWGRDYYNEESRDSAYIEMMQYIADCHPDIVCIQEGGLDGPARPVIDSIIRPQLPYIEAVVSHHFVQTTIFSKYPIVRKDSIYYETTGNGSAAFWLQIHGKEVIVVDNHLQSMGLSLEDRAHFSEMMHGDQERDSMKETSHTIFGKILEATCKRAPQADSVAQFIRMHKANPIIVCGDFNDLPLSYVHRTIAKELTDCYESTGFGPGFTLSHFGMRVRIDNILCSSHFQPYNCFVDNSISLSDHYPMRCWLKMK